jgi:two-component system CheB/CheR fusion protein
MKSTKSKKRVLVIEDDAAQAEALKEALQLTGCTIELSLNGKDGIKKARDLHPDVVLCDIRLPDIDGFEVARQIRADPEMNGTHLFALSAYAFPEHRKQSELAGFEAHLSKPPSFDELERCIAQAASGEATPAS